MSRPASAPHRAGPERDPARPPEGPGGSRRRQAVDVLRQVGPPLALGIGVLTALWTAVGLALVRSRIDGWDRDLAETLVRHRRPVLDTLTGIATWPAETITVALLWLLAVGLLARVTSDWVAPVFLSVALAGEKSTYLFASLIVDRPRPPVPPLGHLHATASWPSGHVGAAVCLYGALAVLAFRHRWPRSPAVRAVLLIAAGAVVAGVMVSRCYRGMHYPTDVFGGLVLGVTWLALAGAIVRRAERRVGRRPGRPLIRS